MHKKLYYFACWYHILELLPGVVFGAPFEPSTGPNIKLFHTFWDALNHNTFHNAMQDTTTSGLLIPVPDKLIDFIKQQS